MSKDIVSELSKNYNSKRSHTKPVVYGLARVSRGMHGEPLYASYPFFSDCNTNYTSYNIIMDAIELLSFQDNNMKIDRSKNQIIPVTSDLINSVLTEFSRYISLPEAIKAPKYSTQLPELASFLELAKLTSKEKEPLLVDKGKYRYYLTFLRNSTPERNPVYIYLRLTTLLYGLYSDDVTITREFSEALRKELTNLPVCAWTESNMFTVEDLASRMVALKLRGRFPVIRHIGRLPLRLTDSHLIKSIVDKEFLYSKKEENKGLILP